MNKFFSKKQRAFTLIEIILVVLLLSVASALAVPYILHSAPSFQIKKSAEDLAHSIRYAQAKSLMKNKILRIVFDRDYKNYWIEEKGGASIDPDQGIYSRIAGSMGRLVEVPVSLEIIDAPAQILFYPDGQIEKVRFEICRAGRKDCLTVTTREQRGEVSVFPSDYSNG